MVIAENESKILLSWLSERQDDPRTTSGLAAVEVVRACLRFDESAMLRARGLLATLHIIPLTTQVLEHAGLVGPPFLRSLDAIHLVSALSIRQSLSAFVAYDRRLLAAAEGEHLPVVAPS